MNVPTRANVLGLYRRVLRSGRKFADYNFREYVIRIAREDFRLHAAERDPQRIAAQFADGKVQAEVAERQAIINAMYSKTHSILTPK
jgi:hypothetical protein